MANEKRLIDANALIETLEKIATEDETPFFHLDEITQEIFDTPTVDAVEVVRCKDCKFSRHFENRYVGDLTCMYWWADTEPNGFCNHGESKYVDCEIAENIESCEDCGFCAMLERKDNE